jgi:uncharacterized protein YndB with AHSA1/START domain
MDDYTKDLYIGAAPRAVYPALTTLEGCSSWWAPASGSAAAGGELSFTFDDPGSPLVLRVAEAATAAVTWHVSACPFLPDWVGTTITFRLRATGEGGTELSFQHAGLSPRLDCFDECQAGWNYYLPSLREYAESGAGRPYRRGGD